MSMAKKKMSPQKQLAAAMYALNQRRVQVWIPFLEAKIAELHKHIEEKQGQEAE